MSAEADSTVSRPAPRRAAPRFRLAVRWKLLAAFAGAFTVVFVFIAFWVVQHATANAMDRIKSQLSSTAIGGAQTLDARAFAALVESVPAVPDASNPTGYTYPDSLLYRQIARQLLRITEVVPSAQPYTYFRDPANGQLYFAVSAGYYYDPQFGVTFKQPVSEVSGPETIARMERGLTRTTEEPAYTDTFGDWVSAYSPILNDKGESVGAIGVDYPLDYVAEVQANARRDLAPILLATYALLLLLVLVISGYLVRPLRRLTDATHRIAEGEYDLEVRELVKSRFPDELYELGESFEIMAAKVAARERSLTKEVQRLRVEIDTVKREQSVEEITGTDFFSDLKSKAATLRARMHEDDDADRPARPAGAPSPAAPGGPESPAAASSVPGDDA